MGQCYTVEARLNFKNNDPSAFCTCIANEITARNGVSAIFDLSRGKLDDPFGCFKILTAVNADQDPNGIYYADFSASYGWESVMFEIFKEAILTLDDDSFIHIFPDSGSYYLSIQNGKYIVLYSDEADIEDDEDAED